eukprot:GHVL01035301.1.p2 GENE.GHVL01035301.1~~GHVL01035301.1.p2  ORF type:complete len:220 (+),score=52.46 GHVL01035301.1:753-1412(+)
MLTSKKKKIEKMIPQPMKTRLRICPVEDFKKNTVHTLETVEKYKFDDNTESPVGVKLSDSLMKNVTETLLKRGYRIVESNNISNVSTKAQLKEIFPWRHQFDRIIVDSQCTHDGSPKHITKMSDEQKTEYNKKLTDDTFINETVNLQKQLLTRGFDLLRKGGNLVYCTCSLMKRQNEDVVNHLRNFKNVQERQIPFLVVCYISVIISIIALLVNVLYRV